MSQKNMFGIHNMPEVDQEIKDNQKQFDFDIREYPIEVIAMKFDPRKQDAEFFIPDYQRDFVWSQKQQSLFIESLLIGLPIPYLFVADVEDNEIDTKEGNVEIIDGAQRIQTIYAYLNNQLQLVNMERLASLEDSYFSDLPAPRQKRFNRTTVRMIELKKIDEDGRRLMFDRLNSGGTKLTDMEKWIGEKKSKFIDFVRELSKHELFVEMTPLPKSKSTRRERVLYTLRFFAYRDRYSRFGEGSNKVIDFLENYMDDMEKNFGSESKAELAKDFEDMLKFVKANFSFGFRKSEKAKSVSRIRFEAIAVGTSLALKSEPDLSLSRNTNWVCEDVEFLAMIRSDASNSRPKVISRVEFVRDKLLEHA